MAPPDDEKIESTLRDTVRSVFRADDLDNLTVKRIRQRAEEVLGLETGWLKSHAQWRDRSSELIQEEVENQENGEKEPAATASKKPSVANGKKRASEDAVVEKPKKKQKMQKSAKKVQPRKRAVVESEIEDEDESVESEAKDEERHQSAPPSPVTAPEPKSDSEMSSLSSLIDDLPVKSKTKSKSKPAKKPSKPKTAVVEDSDSNLSSLNDDPLPKKKSAKTSKPKASKPRPSKPKDATATSKNDDELKTLQGWLLKCGIRKKWATVLAAYDTPKEKIQYLKEQLKELGMDGRYTAAKAKEIKESRELAAELEAVQEFATDWGKGGGKRGQRAAAPRRLVIESDDDEESGDGTDEVEAPRRKLAEYDFGDEDSG